LDQEADAPGSVSIRDWQSLFEAQESFMLFASQVPSPPLDEFIENFWFYEELDAPYPRERILPNGTFELIFNLCDTPRLLFSRDESGRAQEFRRAWFSGAHTEYIVVDVVSSTSLLGAHFRPGGAALFLGLPADELRDRVVELDELWGSSANDLRNALGEAHRPADKFRIFERFLARRALPGVPGDPLIRHALRRFRASSDLATIDEVARELGLSHKHFIARFRAAVGLPPKRFCRIQRFQQVLQQIERRGTIVWADLAAGCGYYDQAHFIRDFQDFAGLNPSAYLRERGEHVNFVPLRGSPIVSSGSDR
jgi:AraC-like DNA-binding protein